MKRHFHLFLFCIIGFYTVAFTQVKSTNFSMPIQFPFHLAGCFCEPRTDHFHSGIDIKTNGTEGWPVYSIEDGYISRIRVASNGYGRAIYITHPNGYTSVYAHLQKFNDSLEAFILPEHYKKKVSEIDITLPVGRFPIKKNETIARSGNTGSSGGPHLHFEIRDTKTEVALNPLDFYPSTAYIDSIPPSISALKVYTWEDSYYSANYQIIPLIQVGNQLTTSTPIYISGPNMSFGIQGFDKQYNNENKNGLYNITVLMDNKAFFSRTFNTVDFSTTRAVSACIDYQEQQANNRDIYHCFQLPGNPIKTDGVNNGILSNIKDSTSLTIHCSDYANNTTTIQLRLLPSKIPMSDSTTSFLFPYNKQNTLYKKGFAITFPPQTFYDNTRLLYTKVQNKQNDIYSDIHQLNGIQSVPLHKAAIVEIQAHQIPLRLLHKAYIICRDKKGNESTLTAQHRKHWLTANTKQLGDFYARIDTIAPVISLQNYDAKQTRFSTSPIVVNIKDAQSGIATYNGYIDGKWVNFYYDAKNNKMSYTPDEYCSKGEHILKIVVKDKCDNSSTLQKKFIY